MVFSSPVFVFLFLPFVYISTLIPSIKIKNVILLIASLLFYAWGEPVYVFLMIASVFVNYLLALPAASEKTTRRRKTLFIVLTVVFNIALLGVFKYADFLVGTLNGLLGLGIPMPCIQLPIGISFFTFQTMSYVLDVYMGTTSVQKSYFKVLLYVSFFPQLIAGPIVKYHDIAAQLDDRHVTPSSMASGIRRFVIGLSKKLFVANATGYVADQVFALAASDVNLPIAWIGAVAYCLQIYFDFSAYSDMAIGLGRMAGFEFLENFNFPYISQSIQEFWRRWHISLSTWFKEYVYIPLGGNRKGKARAGLNKVIVFFLTGLWHGAQWTFVVWGLFHGLFIMLEAYGVIQPQKWRWRPLRHIYLLLVVLVGFVLFRAETFGTAQNMIVNLFAGFRASPALPKVVGELFTRGTIYFMLLGVVFSAPLVRFLQKTIAERLPQRQRFFNRCGYAVTMAAFLLSILSLSSTTFNPFIYFRF